MDSNKKLQRFIDESTKDGTQKIFVRYFLGKGTFEFSSEAGSIFAFYRGGVGLIKENKRAEEKILFRVGSSLEDSDGGRSIFKIEGLKNRLMKGDFISAKLFFNNNLNGVDVYICVIKK